MGVDGGQIAQRAYASRVLSFSTVPAVVEHPHFRPWLQSLPGAVAAKVVDGIEYMAEHGRGAVLPDVRHRIQTSRHFPNLSEVRADQVLGERRYVMWVLVCFVDDDTSLLVCVDGDKEHYQQRVGRDFYNDYVAVADQLIDNYKKGALR